MKNSRLDFLRNVGDMMLLAGILHTVMLHRGAVEKCNKKKGEKTSEKVDEAFKRLCEAVDCAGSKAEKLLKQKMAHKKPVKETAFVFTLSPTKSKNTKQYK